MSEFGEEDLRPVESCPACHRKPSPLWECSRAECPRRRPGASLHGTPPLRRNHDGLGWDRFYQGRRSDPTADLDGER